MKAKKHRYSHWGSYGGLKDNNSGKNKYWLKIKKIKQERIKTKMGMRKMESWGWKKQRKKETMNNGKERW